MRRSIEALQQLLPVLGAQSALAHQILTKTARSDRNVSRQNRYAVLEDVDVRDVVSDVQQANNAGHRVGMIDFKTIVQSERFDIHDGGRKPRLGEDTELGLDEFPLCGDEQDAHLGRIALGVQRLMVELHRFDIERHMLLGLPAEQLP